MSSAESTRLRSGKIIELATISQSFRRMAEQSTVETECVGDSSVSSQIAEIKDSYEKKFNKPKSEIGQLKDLMIAMMDKSNSPSTNAQVQGSSKQPVRRSDRSLT